MTTNELRHKFLEFFKKKKHSIISSDSLIPSDDPTLLFTGSGMNQFKEYFLAQKKDLKRAVSSQKCLRTSDLDKVGKTPSHHTFFEMLGNFSFGDYFKEEAILWAWEFVTKELKLPKERFWVSVYKDDKEAYNIWQKKVNIPKEKIVCLGAEDNFWPANAPLLGPNGPCGPCSEIFYDQGEKIGCQKKSCSVSCGCGRFIEIWNLVFTQFNRVGKNKLEPLPQKNIDTGMGLERIAAVIQNKQTNFEIDIIDSIIKEIKKTISLKRSPAKCSADNKEHLRAIADHIRAVVFAVSDGVLPSNDGRGYVVRKLIRRAFLRAGALGNKDAFIYKIVPKVASLMEEPYPELKSRRENIASILIAEENRFKETIRAGSSILNDKIEELKTAKKKEIPGEAVFDLYDTYGFPLELTESIALKQGLKVDSKKFAMAMEKQKKRSKSKSQIASEIFVKSAGIESVLRGVKMAHLKSTTESYEQKTKVMLILKAEEIAKEAKKGDRVSLILQDTPFYGEAGGQAGDQGIIKSKNANLEVIDTKIVSEKTLHIANVIEGKIKTNDEVTASVDCDFRDALRRSHTATHLLQAALREVLGHHVEQSGSWVGPDKFRFDFTHFKAIEARELRRVTEIVTKNIISNDKVKFDFMNLKEAKKKGALAFFGEKYKEEVRLVSVGDYSKELCGGKHVNSTGDIGILYITGESSVASGVRRIEAVTGGKAYKEIEQDKQIINEALRCLNISDKNKLLSELERVRSKLKTLEKKTKQQNAQQGKALLANILSQKKQVNSVNVIGYKVEKADFKLLGNLTDLVIEQANPCVVSLVSTLDEKVFLVTALSPDAVNQGLDARKIISSLAELISGKGGGRVNFAQAGGKNPSRIGDIIKELPKIVERNLKK